MSLPLRIPAALLGFLACLFSVELAAAGVHHRGDHSNTRDRAAPLLVPHEQFHFLVRLDQKDVDWFSAVIIRSEFEEAQKIGKRIFKALLNPADLSFRGAAAVKVNTEMFGS